MPETATPMEEIFSFGHFTPALNGFKPPRGPFDPAGAWTQGYNIIMALGRTNVIGGLRIQREPLPGGKSRLKVAHQKRAAGGSLHLTAEIDCSADALSKPTGWRLETVVQDAAGKPMEETRLRESVTVQGDHLLVSDGATQRKLNVSEPFTMPWALMDAVQRLPSREMHPQSFTLVDRLNNQVKPGHLLSPHGEKVVALGGRSVWTEEKQPLEVGTVFRPVRSRQGTVSTTLRAYRETGHGILPTVYWVDEQGRLLFVFSGLIAYVYNPDVEV